MSKLFEKIRENYDNHMISVFVLGGCAGLSLVTTYMSLKNLAMSTKCALEIAKKEK